MPKVLVVDDEPQTVTTIEQSLSRAGHEVIVARGLEELVSCLAQRSPDLLLLGPRLVEAEGVEVVRRLRSCSDVAIVLVFRGDDHRARVRMLDAGADDVVAASFPTEELRARVGAVLRRAGQRPVREARGHHVLVDDLHVDLATRQVTRGGARVRLTPLQWRLLEVLVRNPGRVLPHRTIISSVWGEKHGDEVRASLRAHLVALREKLGDDAAEQRLIATEPGVGYRWVGSVSESTREATRGSASEDW